MIVSSVLGAAIAIIFFIGWSAMADERPDWHAVALAQGWVDPEQIKVLIRTFEEIELHNASLASEITSVLEQHRDTAMRLAGCQLALDILTKEGEGKGEQEARR